ncbi:MAG: molybdopterin-binding protein [Gammaproteobacteria bacterium]
MTNTTFSPSACVLLIGNEILSGRTQDKNLSFIGQALARIGIPLMEARVIPDIHAVIIDTLNECRHKYDYVFTTGGIGPTHDDITTVAVAAALDLPVIRHPEADRTLRDYYGAKANAARMKMADVPDGAELIANPLSMAPGYRIENVFVLAGVPAIMQAMMDAIIPQLRQGTPILSRTLRTDLREGELAAGLNEIQNRYADISIGSYPFFTHDKLGVNLVLRGIDTEQLDNAANAVEALIKSLDGEVQRLDD